MLRSVFLLIAGAQGARVARQTKLSGSTKMMGTKMMAGITVHNYHLAFQDAESEEQDWVVVFNSGVKQSGIDNICQRVRQGCKLVGHPESLGVPFLEVRSTEEEMLSVLKPFAELVKFVEPDMTMTPIPEVEAKIGAASLVQTEAKWGLERIGASSRFATGLGVHIYVVDTGVRATHSDFGGRVIPTADLTSGDLVECGDNLGCADDFQGHGTHCAGIAGGAGYGVATQASLHSIRVFSASESPLSWSYAALDWIASQGARPAVTSMSLGTEGKIAAMKESVDAAVSAGVTVVVASGNFNTDACGYSPAFVPSAITVSSTDPGDGRSDFSNFGSCVDIYAPGTEITSLSHSGDAMTKVLSGTSMACPFVSGAAALHLQSSPTMSPSQVHSKILDSAMEDAVVFGLTSDDDNKLLWVGSGPAPAPTPLSCPDGTYGPDSDKDCMCTSGRRCYQDGDFGCRCSSGDRCSTYFVATCYNCKCYR